MSTDAHSITIVKANWRQLAQFFKLRLRSSLITISFITVNNKNNLHLTKGRKMKKLLVIAVALASVNAFATRARVNALANSPHLVDAQTVYTNPADMFVLGGDYVTIESGNTDATTLNDGAEGMVVRSMGDAKMGLSLGHDSKNAYTTRMAAMAPVAAGGLNLFPAKSKYLQQNPIELSYGMKSGDVSWAGTLVYSKFQSKTGINEKEDTMGLKGGMRMGAIDAYLGLGLSNNYQNDTDGKFKGTLGLLVGAGYQMDNMYFNGTVTSTGFKTEDIQAKETSKMELTQIELKATTSHKKDGSEFFYGAGLTSYTAKETVADTKQTDMYLPVWMGLEVDANSWMTLRGSITQNVLLDSHKTEAAGVAVAETNPGANNTQAAVGVGLKFNKVTVDGSLQGLTGTTQDQRIAGDKLLGNVGLTYMF